jgi:hypothetical protein
VTEILKEKMMMHLKEGRGDAEICEIESRLRLFQGLTRVREEMKN